MLGNVSINIIRHIFCIETKIYLFIFQIICIFVHFRILKMILKIFIEYPYSIYIVLKYVKTISKPQKIKNLAYLEKGSNKVRHYTKYNIII